MPGHFCAQSGNEPVQLHCLFLRHPKHISLRLPEDEHVLQRSVLPLVRQRERLTQPVRDFHEDTVADILKILPIQAERRVQIPFRGVGNDDLTEDFPRPMIVPKVPVASRMANQTRSPIRTESLPPFTFA